MLSEKSFQGSFADRNRETPSVAPCQHFHRGIFCSGSPLANGDQHQPLLRNSQTQAAGVLPAVHQPRHEEGNGRRKRKWDSRSLQQSCDSQK